MCIADTPNTQPHARTEQELRRVSMAFSKNNIILTKLQSASQGRGGNLRNHHFKKHLEAKMATGSNLLNPQTAPAQHSRRCRHLVFPHAECPCEPGSHSRRHSWGRGRFPSSSTCRGFPGVTDCIADKLQIQYCVLGIVYWVHKRYHFKKHQGG